jgi:hypothetical protein
VSDKDVCKEKHQEVNGVSELSSKVLIPTLFCVTIWQNYYLNYLRVKLINYSDSSFKDRVKMLSYTSPQFHLL